MGLGYRNLVRVAGGTRPTDAQRQKLTQTAVSFENLSVWLHINLGLNGEADTGDSFKNLNKGWLKITIKLIM
ncbi:hypothetical protein [Campylobacter hyointestinalis]|uniref:hypothetical protein n=1 Tax=Campylobacter hyointestinalis TaxID=198 RepID=UPI000DD0A27D|nr:hypothetical protein [Campylobacter hyointestinalis]